MNIVETGIKELYVLEPKVFGDHTGYFLELYIKEVFEGSVGKYYYLIQDNESKSSYGGLRGLHFQVPHMFKQNRLDLS